MDLSFTKGTRGKYQKSTKTITGSEHHIYLVNKRVVLMDKTIIIILVIVIIYFFFTTCTLYYLLFVIYFNMHYIFLFLINLFKITAYLFNVAV